jgi:LysM repeat protein
VAIQANNGTKTNRNPGAVTSTGPRYAVPVSSYHTVVPGQTLAHVAKVHGVSAESIAGHPANRGRVNPGGVMQPGTRLHIPGKPLQQINPGGPNIPAIPPANGIMPIHSGPPGVAVPL